LVPLLEFNLSWHRIYARKIASMIGLISGLAMRKACSKR
jgi:hypothetical protein